MSDDAPIEVVVEPPQPEVSVVVEPRPADTPAVVTEVPPVVVVVEPPLPDLVVDVHTVGLPGPKGEDGADGIGAQEAITIIDDHISSPNPHPVYDDGPSLFLLYLNAKV